MPSRPFIFLLAAALVVALAGCDTFERRSQQKAAAFASLTPDQREKLKHGTIELGQTPDMVYIALGEPDEKHETTTAKGRDIAWIYYSYRPEYEGTVRTGVHRVLVYDASSKRSTVFLDPIYSDIYSEHAEENIRVTFRDGKVTEIELPKE